MILAGLAINRACEKRIAGCHRGKGCVALRLTSILAAARTAVDAMDSTLDMEDLRLSALAAVSPSEAAVLIARGRLPNEDTCTSSAHVRQLRPRQGRAPAHVEEAAQR